MRITLVVIVSNNWPMNSLPTILMVDDDWVNRSLVVTYLGSNGYLVRCVDDGSAMWRALGEDDPEMVLLSCNLHGEDGLTICRQLRDRSFLPVIILADCPCALDRILGLEAGADDYIAKPFELRELLARMRNILRPGNGKGSATALSPQSIQFSGWRLDLVAGHLLSPKDTVFALSRIEFCLLHAFLSHPNQVLRSDQLLGLTNNPDDRLLGYSVDTQIDRLHRKIRQLNLPVILKTVNGSGYVLEYQ